MAITAAQVMELREQTGAGMMDCKNALNETNGDMEKAIKILREKGIAKAEKRSGRATKEGMILSYIHPGSKLGVLVEVNCETDFVARTDDFKEFVKDIAMHIAAASPLCITANDVPEDIKAKEMDIYRNQSKNEGKPEKMWDKIAEGKMSKFFKDSCLVEQVFVKDPERKKTIQDLLNEMKAKTGENMSIARFVRFELGETSKKEETAGNE